MIGAVFSCSLAGAQLPLTDLSAFRQPGKTWRLAGDVNADLGQNNVLRLTNGTGVLVNLPTAADHGADLYTLMEHGDVDVELDYMMAKGSNSGIYLQGRYEIQLLDSWGVRNPKAGDNGGIYERWDESRPEGSKGYDGYAPRQNASKAPGLWQRLFISFQAPRFDAAGRKTENARVLRVELNGVTLHENVELLGVTRGAISAEEKPVGPLRIQGDHGAVAFRNIRITPYDKTRPELANLKYAVYNGKFEKAPDFAKQNPAATGASRMLTSSLQNLGREFLLRYTGTLNVQEPGEYRFNLVAPGGNGMVRINQQDVPLNEWGRGGKAVLPAGQLPFELVYNKTVEWTRPALSLSVAGPGIREFMISDAAAATEETDPVLVDAAAHTVLRSFMDVPGKRIVHAVSVGSPEGVHYTYDLDNGHLVQAWRGAFLDATPMWHDRGNGASRPRGALTLFGNPMPTLAALANTAASWPADTTAAAFRPKGYVLDDMDRPTFRYTMHGADVTDAIRVLDGGQGLRREITTKGGAPFYARLAEANAITLENGVYIVGDKTYFIRVEGGGETPLIRDAGGQKQLLVPVRSKLVYDILF